MEEAEYGDCQRSALGRIGSGAQLIKETEGIAVRLLQDGNNVGHVGGEGTEALLNTLLVSDVGKHLFKDSQLRSVKRRYMEACLPHQGK